MQSNPQNCFLLEGGQQLSQEFSTVFTGRRKCAIAQVKLIEGGGELVINGKPASVYMQENAFAITSIEAPLRVVKLQKKCGIIVNVEGGGLTAQAQAIKLGIARALSALKPSFRASLKEKGLLSRDARCKERRKYGLKKARKAPQFSKR
jgi:small subunit ribosomal protein S9